MTAIAPQTHLKPMSEVVSHPDTLFLPDGTNRLGDGHFQFSSRLRTVLTRVVLQACWLQVCLSIWNMFSDKCILWADLRSSSFWAQIFFFLLSYQLPGNVIFVCEKWIIIMLMGSIYLETACTLYSFLTVIISASRKCNLLGSSLTE